MSHCMFSVISLNTADDGECEVKLQEAVFLLTNYVFMSQLRPAAVILCDKKQLLLWTKAEKKMLLGCMELKK